MSLNPLKIATRGYLKRNTKAVLVIAVAGYLNYGTPTPTTPIRNPATHVTDDDGGGRKLSALQKELDRKRKLIEEDEEQWLVFMAAFLKTL